MKNKKFLSSKRGFTILEILLALAIISIIAGVVVNLLRSPLMANTYVEDDFKGQSSLRQAVRVIDSNVRSSTQSYLKYKPYNGTFAAQGNSLRTDISPEWDYIIFETDNEGNSRLVHYTWPQDPNTTQHEMNVLFESDYKFDYKFKFTKPTNWTENPETKANGDKEVPVENRVGYELVIQRKDANGNPVGAEQVITSTLQPVNIANAATDYIIVDYPESDKDKVNTLAFRAGAVDASKTTKEQTSKLAVQFVLDLSNSMYQNLDGLYDSNTTSAYFYYDQRYGKSLYYNGYLYNPNNINGILKGFFANPEYAGREGTFYREPLYNVVYDRRNNSFDISNNSRIEILRPALYGLFDNLSKMQGAYAGITSFASKSERSDTLVLLNDGTDSNNLQLTTEGRELLNNINYILPYPHGQLSGTNVIDGVRRGFFQLKEFAESPQALPQNQNLALIILTDGQYNTSPSIRNRYGRRSYEKSDIEKYGSNAISENLYMYDNYNRVIPSARDYINGFTQSLGEIIKDFKDSYDDPDAKNSFKTYVIAFSGKDSDKQDAAYLGDAFNAEIGTDSDGNPTGVRYFDAKDAASLNLVFEKITQDIYDASSIWTAGKPE